jgi:5-methylcytosine-specific restriction endonuclease McrA
MAIVQWLRKLVFDRDDWHCIHCNSTFGLDPHHIKFVSQGGKDCLENLICLCRICHNAVHDGFLKIELIDGEVRFTRMRGWKP